MKKDIVTILLVFVLAIISLVSVLKREKASNYKTILSSTIYGEYNNILMEGTSYKNENYVVINSTTEYGPTWKIGGDIDLFKGKGVKFEIDIDSENNTKSMELVLVCRDKSIDENFFYHSINCKDDTPPGTFKHVESVLEFKDDIKQKINSSTEVKIFIWNNNHGIFKIKDVAFTAID